MHIRQLIELAAIISLQTPAFLRGCEEVPIASLERYTSLCLERAEKWELVLHDYRGYAELDVNWKRDEIWGFTQNVLEEIFMADILSRVWMSVVACYDQTHLGSALAEKIEPAYQRQLESINDAMSLMLHGSFVPLQYAAKLSRLRGRTERWVDLLLSHLVVNFEIDRYTISAERAHDFASDRQGSSASHHFQQAWPLVHASLQTAFREDVHQQSPHADLHRQISAQVMSCFGPELFDSTGLLQSLWMTRLTSSVDEVQANLEHLVASRKQFSSTLRFDRSG